MNKKTMKLIENGRKQSDGHFTLYIFTTVVQASFETPPDEIRVFKGFRDDADIYNYFSSIPSVEIKDYSSLEDAIEAVVNKAYSIVMKEC